MDHVTIVELSDILAVRLKCLNDGCGASLSLPLSAIEKDKEIKGLAKCPTCGNLWMTAKHPVSVDLPIIPEKTPTVHDLARSVFEAARDLLKRLKDQPETDIGFTVALEIRRAPIG